MGLKKLNSEYNSHFKTFKVHRPVTTKAKVVSRPIDTAPEALESSRRAGLLSNQFTNVTEPALQRRRIVPYRHNHNIFSTSTVKQLNDGDWLEAVGNDGDDQISTAGSGKRKDTKTVDATEYNSRFSKLKVEDDSPVILASKAKVKHKPKDQDRKTKTSATVRSPYIIEKSPERLPPAGVPTYIADPDDKRLLRPCDDLLNPVTAEEVHRTSQTEYTERYQSSSSAERDVKKPLPSSKIDMDTYKRVLLQRNDAYGLTTRPSSASPAKHQYSPRYTPTKKTHSRPQTTRRLSLESKHSDSSIISERRREPLSSERMFEKRERTRLSPRRSVHEESVASKRPGNHFDATKKRKKRIGKQYTLQDHQENEHRNLYEDSLSSHSSRVTNHERKEKLVPADSWEKSARNLTNRGNFEKESALASSHSSRITNHERKEKLVPADPRAKSARNLTTRGNFEKESVSSVHSGRSFESKIRKENEKLKNSGNPDDKSVKRAWKKKAKTGTKSPDAKRNSENIQERGRSPTPEMRTAGQSRRHHLDITTGSNNPLATGPDPRFLENERPVVYDPKRYSDVGESLNSSRSFASWSDHRV